MSSDTRDGSDAGHAEDLSHTIRLLAAAASEVSRYLQAADTGVVAVLDVRRLGEINGKHGPAVGDRVLAAMERSLRRHATDRGCVARLPGDQFIVIQPGSHDEHAAAEGLRRAARVWVPVLRGGLLQATSAVGVATWTGNDDRRTAIGKAAARLHAW